MIAQPSVTSERSYRVLFDLHPIPLWVYDETTGRILTVNDAAIEAYGYTREEFLQLRIDDLRPPSELPRLRSYLETPGERGHSAGVWTHRRRDGSLREVEIHSHPVHLDGAAARLVIAIDVTDKRRQERELLASEARLRELNHELEQRVQARTEDLQAANERADKVKSRLLSTVSHELRTPLNSIIGFTDLLLHGIAGPLSDEQAKQIGIVNESGKQLLALISDFLDISKIEAGVLPLQPTEFRLDDVLAEAAATHGASAQSRGLQLSYAAPDDGTRARADLRRVRQVVDNLLSNAIKFTDAGSIRISCDAEGPHCRVTIEDTGIGIAADRMPRLFEPFALVEDKAERTRQGTGLGLAISKRLVELMGGKIGAASEPDRGSRFWFTLPRAE
jgi:PAS domain S-box-containing protein